MEFFRRAANPWGQEVLLGIAWDLVWAAIVAGGLFLVVHTLVAARRGAGRAPAAADTASGSARIVRHSAAARWFHWSMAIAMLTLLVTAFVPVMGLQFDWVTLHWIAGLVLIATILWHIVQALFWQSMRNVWIGAVDVRDGAQELSHFVGGGDPPARRPGKYPIAQKLFHHIATIAALAAIVTGLLMMVRIDTPLFRQNQYLLEDRTWGLVYVVHGLGGVLLITLVIAHIYFAIRPEKRWLTRSMFKGWITNAEYLAHHDPQRWSVEPSPAGPATDAVSMADPASTRPGG
ncbi:MAG: cytochrome b/b6 domain-containing protein [Gemmatimonadetes bacterium]|nr:cytochrome b/b6 domain-containing protein [Gemmatimonadota bacterium]